MAEQKRSEFAVSEDWWSIYIGFTILIIGLILFLGRPPKNAKEIFKSANQTIEQESSAPFKTIEWYKANDKKESVKASKTSHGSFLKDLTSKPHKWNDNPINAFFMSDEEAKINSRKAEKKYLELKSKEETALNAAIAAQSKAKEQGYKVTKLNNTATEKIEMWRQSKRLADSAKKKTKAEGYNQIGLLILVAFILAVLFGVGMKVMQGQFLNFITGFIFVFLLAVLSYLFSQQSLMKEYGIGYALWAILIGLIISNTIGTPKWVKPAVQTEYFIKTGLVLLGAEVLFGKIIQIGIPGLLVAWVVTPVVIITSFWFGKRIIKLASDELNITMSAAMSVCGVSAAIATAAACKAKKEELTLAVGLSLIFTAIMMVLMPAFISAVGMTEILGGAWMGGVIDSTGAVAAAGAFLGEKALYVSATIKMIQNILIGIVAFVVAIYWTMKKNAAVGQKPNAMEIWYRFPKFVIGFAAASVLSSVVASSLGADLAYAQIDNGLIGAMTKNLRGWMFCLAFVSIGLSTNFKELSSQFSGGKPFWLYIFGQSFNLFLTLLIAWLSFYVIFPYITEAI